MTSLRFETLPSGYTTVYLEGKVIGEIRKDADGFRYYPKGQRKGGDAFATLAACKLSLADDED